MIHDEIDEILSLTRKLKISIYMEKDKISYQKTGKTRGIPKYLKPTTRESALYYMMLGKLPTYKKELTKKEEKEKFKRQMEFMKTLDFL